MKVLIISNFRVGSWMLHDRWVRDGCLGLGEIADDRYSERDTVLSHWLSHEGDMVTILHPIQWYGGDYDKVIKDADKITYLQRENTLQQTVSYAIASKEKKWMDDRNPYTEKIYEEELDESYKVLHMQHDIIQQLYDRYPSEVLTLEKHFTHNPYKNRYKYEGDWNPQKNLWLNQ